MADAPVTIRITGAENPRKHLAEYRRLLRGRITGSLREVLTEAVTYGRSTQLSGGAGSPQVRSGRLRRAFRFRLNPRQNVVRARLGFLGRKIGYAYVQEYGAPSIRPKRSKYLLIPLQAALTRTGRRSLRVTRQRERGNTFVRGRVVYERRGKNTIVPLFVLVRQVSVPARPTLRPVWSRFQPQLMRRLDDAINAPVGLSLRE